jgi:hypothetical protein
VKIVVSHTTKRYPTIVNVSGAVGVSLGGFSAGDQRSAEIDRVSTREVKKKKNKIKIKH